MLKFSTYSDLLENEGLKKKAEKSGVSYGTLKKVYNRGMAAWKTGHRPGTTPQQWGMARVNSYITKGKGTYHGADKDLRDDVQYEAYDPKHVKQAIGIASDPRYKKGNMTGAVKAMNKISKDIHKHPQVAAVLRRQNESKVNEISKGTLTSYIKKAGQDKSRKWAQRDLGKRTSDDAYANQVKRNKGIDMAKSKMKPSKVAASEATVKEISKNLAKSYIGKASRDVYDKGQQQGTANAISRLGGPDQDYKKSPERKAAKRVAGIDRATNRLMKKEAMSPAEKAAHQKAIDAFKAKGGKVKKLKPGYAQGYHGKADPGAGIKGMISKDDTSQFGTKKKVGSMK